MSSPLVHIAVVDDDERMCQALGRLLRVAGYTVKSYYSAEAYLGDPAHGRSVFLVADVELRGMSGLELHARLRREGQAPPVAFITAHDEADVRAQAAAAGCAAYFRKPFPGRDLLEAIRAALGQSTAGS